jgi:hypothetical protein
MPGNRKLSGVLGHGLRDSRERVVALNQLPAPGIPDTDRHFGANRVVDE